MGNSVTPTVNSYNHPIDDQLPRDGESSTDEEIPAGDELPTDNKLLPSRELPTDDKIPTTRLDFVQAGNPGANYDVLDHDSRVTVFVRERVNLSLITFKDANMKDFAQVKYDPQNPTILTLTPLGEYHNEVFVEGKKRSQRVKNEMVLEERGYKWMVIGDDAGLIDARSTDSVLAYWSRNRNPEEPKKVTELKIHKPLGDNPDVRRDCIIFTTILLQSKIIGENIVTDLDKIIRPEATACTSIYSQKGVGSASSIPGIST